MRRDNSKTKKLVTECWQEIDGITDLLRNMLSVSEFVEEDFQFQLTSTRNQLEKIKDNLNSDYKYVGQREDLTLTALEAYTEGRASWERAGEISGLGRWGLTKYCGERGVDHAKLRIDSYMNFTGPEAEKIISREWDKLTNPKARKGD